MKYYCENCETMWEPNEKTTLRYDLLCCPFCQDPKHSKVSRIPDYETPEQYEKRTDKPYPDNGAVFYPNGDIYAWNAGITSYKNWKEIITNLSKEAGHGDFLKSAKSYPVVIADPPVPPPDNWRPE